MRTFRQYATLREDANNNHQDESLNYLHKAVELQIRKNPYVLASWLETNGDDAVKDMIKEFKNRQGDQTANPGLGDLSNDNLETIKSPPHHPDSSNGSGFDES
jgi:hypothetical protein